MSEVSNAGPSSQVASTSNNVRSLTSKPARKQVTHREVENIRQSTDKANQSGITYNIWYNKYSGGEYDDGKTQNVKSSTRVKIAKDAGYTRANRNGGAFVCLFFARGYCPNGQDCTFLHMLPVDVPDQGHDVFGREKHGDFRDDMGGVGSIQRVNRTLYVGHIHEESNDMSSRQQQQQQRQKHANGDRKDTKWNAFSESGGKGWDRSQPKNQMSPTEKVLFRHFSEFGDLERIRVLHSRGCGFVTYKREVDAQFAKEAMMHQSLDHNECINLRWATDDPNLGAQKRDRLEREREGMQAIKANISEEARRAGQSLLELEQAATLEGYDDEEAGDPKRLRIEASEEGENDNGMNGVSEEEYQQLLEENKRNWEKIEQEDAELQAKAVAEIEAAEEAAANVSSNGDSAILPNETDKENGLFDKKALEALHALRKKQQPTPAALPSKSALTGLADYGSDSD
ncbi:uncharacterized protein FA14DRAFT_138671 [Meira miltonrushii]|uniref:Pre-mRNA-splicing factor CWC2 n=1 Tax=Meira miltonrushii TaxID=1280837 RepID=A0A316V9D0_9BASI|nr:uncharacterized protein FA14DRAFT_138671 [Meira miltonrushii]PWN32085.1 hypothetical protein FA14DRAFT_138671 [Meira miltonrushii]